MVVEELGVIEAEHDLEMVFHRFKAAVDTIIATGKDITPRMAYSLEFIDRERDRLDEYIRTHERPDRESG